MKVVMLGAPGAGKGTQAKKIAAKYNIPHISTGDIFRANIKNGTELGKKAKTYMDQGLLVPDELVVDLVVDRVNQEDCQAGYVLDGFPRTIPQAEALDKALAEQNQKLDFAINVDVPDENIVHRMGGRRACVGLRPCVHHRGPRRRRRPAPGPPQPPRCREAHYRQRLQPPRAVVRPPAFRLVVCGPRGLAVDSAQAPLGRPGRQPCNLAARDRAVGSDRRGPVARPRPGPLRHLHHLPRVGQQPARHIPSPLRGHGQHCCGPAPPVWRALTFVGLFVTPDKHRGLSVLGVRKLRIKKLRKGYAMIANAIVL